MGRWKERRASVLLTTFAWRRLLVAFGFLLVATLISWMEPASFFRSSLSLPESSLKPEPLQEPALTSVEAEKTEPEFIELTPEERKRIENLFAKIEKEPDSRDKVLRELRRVLQGTFAGQEDCWSCEGSQFFDRFDRIAGSGEARKPLGLREWIEEGEEAYKERNQDLAKKFFLKALQVMDERALQTEDVIDQTLIDRLISRCQELDCR